MIEEAPDGRVRLMWRTGAAGCVTPLALGAAGLFFYWARNPDVVTEQDMTGRGGIFIRLAATADAGGIGWGFLAIGLAMGWVALQFGWRFAERVAVTAGPGGLQMHGMFGRAMPWSEVRSVRFVPFRRGAIEITLKHPRPGLFNPIPRTRHRLVGLETDEGAGNAFAQAAERFRVA